MSVRRQLLLDAIGLAPRWVLRTPARGTTATAPDSAAAAFGSAVIALAALDWPQLEAAVAAHGVSCGASCAPLFGSGDASARWLFVGDQVAPEDVAAAQPFAGDAGLLLDNMLRALGLQRGRDVYLTHLVKAPAEAQDFTLQAAAWLPYLQRQIELLQPQVIVVFGAAAACPLLRLGAATPLAALRARALKYAGTPLVVTHAPAHLLQAPADKRQAWDDLQLALAAVQVPASVSARE